MSINIFVRKFSRVSFKLYNIKFGNYSVSVYKFIYCYLAHHIKTYIEKTYMVIVTTLVRFFI